MRREYEDLRREYEDLRYTFNITRTDKNLRGNDNVWLYQADTKQEHLTVKPLALIKNILLHSTNETHLVLDPFLGSGTTAVACKELNRQYIGIEKEEEYFKIAQKRLDEVNNLL